MITFSDNIARKPYLGSTEIAEVWLGNVLIYPEDTVDYSTQYLTFKAIDNGTTFQFNQDGLEYSLNDGSTWNSLGASVDTPSLNTGGKIMFRGNLTITQGYGIGHFFSTGKFNIEGNPLSLVDDTNFANITDLTGMNQIFFQLFYGTDVVDASNLALPATILSQECYTSMFEGCTSLTTAPELPATTLAEYCYQYMFNGCTRLVNAPQLPVTTLASGCYVGMFSGCTSLKTAPALPATTLASSCYASMFKGCTSLTTAPSVLPATTLAYGCYFSMFMNCTRLTTAPELPAETLAQSCYGSMFMNCTSLTTAPALPATTLKNICYDHMFSGCTSLTTAPELPATTLVSRCYQQMFDGCTKLNYIKAMFTTTPSTTYTSSWVKNVAARGTFVKNTSATWNVTGVNGVPSGWTIQRASQ